MPFTIENINAMKHLLNRQLIKQECRICKNEFYSTRQSTYCCAACKQVAYRQRQGSKEEENKKEVNAPIPNSQEKDHNIERLKQLENNYKQKLKKLK